MSELFKRGDTKHVFRYRMDMHAVLYLEVHIAMFRFFRSLRFHNETVGSALCNYS